MGCRENELLENSDSDFGVMTLDSRRLTPLLYYIGHLCHGARLPSTVVMCGETMFRVAIHYDRCGET